MSISGKAILAAIIFEENSVPLVRPGVGLLKMVRWCERETAWSLDWSQVWGAE